MNDLPLDGEDICPHCGQLIPKQRALVAKAPNPVRIALSAFDAKFREKFTDAAPLTPGKDGTIMKRLVGTYGIERVVQLIEAFFDSEDAFITSSTYSVGVFASQIGRLIAAENARPKVFGGTQRTQGNVAVLQRFVNRRQR